MLPGCILKKFKVMDEGSKKWGLGEGEGNWSSSTEAKYLGSNHITLSSISLLAPGRFRGLRELGVSLDWNSKERP